MATVDEKVVELRLDDSQFDKASDRTIKKLDELQSALKFDGAVGSFKEIDKAAKDVDVSPLEKGVKAVSGQFDALATIADAALRRITNQAMAAGENLIKSLTVDNISKGWSKYEEKTSAVQTIMAATAKQFTDTGEQMEYVEEQLERLNWFTDETSYKFLDMVSNIGKFTSNNIALDTSVTAMQGIANWAAISGANVNEAGRAMYNLSQALAVGAVKLIDWKSIENANMSTAEFKETVIQTAEELGTLTKVGEGLWETMAGNEVSIENFNSNLSDAWFSSEVLLQSLDKYGAFSNKLYEIVDASGLMTTQLLDYTDEYVDGTLNIEQAARETGVAVSDLQGYLEILGSEEYELGRRAFRAGQETKTLTEALDYVKEAVSSGWMQSFEYIFGNYTEAKAMWSDLAEVLYDVFVESGNVRNEMLALWKEMGGREKLIEGVKTALKGIYRYVELFQTAWRNVFPQTTADSLYEATKRFQQLMNQLQLTDTAAENIRKTFEGIFTVFKTVGNVAKVVIAGLDPILSLINQIVGGILGVSGGLGELTSMSLPEIFNPERLQMIYETVYQISSVIASIVRLVAALALSGGLGIAQLVSNIWTSFQNGEGGIKGFFQAIFDNFKILFVNLTSGESKISKILGNVKDLLVGIVDKFAEVSGIKDGSIGGFFGSVVNAVKSSGFVDVVSGVVGVIAALLNGISAFITGMLGYEANFQMIVGFFGSQIRILYDWLMGNLANMTVKDIADVMILILIAQFISSLNTLTKKLTTTVTGFSGVLTSLQSTINSWAAGGSLTKWADALNKFTANTKWLQVAIAIGVMAQAIAMLAKMDTKSLGTAVAAMAVATGLLILLEKAMEKLMDAMDKHGNNNSGQSAAKISAAQKIRDVAIGVAAITAALAFLTAQFEGDTVNEMAAKFAYAISTLTIVMAELVIFFAIVDQANFDPRKMTKIGATLSAVALGIALLIPSIAVLTLLDPGAVVGASLALAGLIAAFGALGNLLQNTNWQPILAMTAVITSFGAAMLVVSLACAALMAVDWSSVLQGATLMAAMAAAIAGILLAFDKLGVLTNLGDMIGLSTMLIALAGALSIIAGACTVLTTVKWEDLGKAGAVLVGLLAVFSGFALVANTFATGILAVSVGLLSFGAACLMIAGAISITVGAVAEIIAILAVLMVAGDQFGDDFGPMIEKAFDAFELIMTKILQLIRALAPEFAATLTALILVIGNATTVGIIKLLPEITETLLQVGIALCDVIIRLGKPFLQALIEVINILTEGLPDLLEAIGVFIEELFAGIGVILNHAIKGLVKGAFNILGIEIETGAGGLSSYIGGTLEDMVTNEFGPGIKDALLEQEGIWFDEMGNAFKGNGVEAIQVGGDELAKAAKRCGENIGNELVEEGFKEEVGDHSPWQSIIDSLKNAGLGFDVGTSSILDGISTNGQIMGNTLIQGILQSLADGAIQVDDAMSSLAGLAGQVPDENTELSHYRNLGGAKREMKDEWTPEIEEEQQEAEDNAWDAGFDIGDSFSSGLGSGMSTAVDAYADALDAIDIREQARETEYSLWEAEHDRASEAEVIAEQIRLATDTIGFEQERLDIYSKKYDEAVAKYGQNASETISAKTSLMEAQMALLDAQANLADLQESYQLALDQDQIDDLQMAADIAQAEVDFYEAMGDAADEGVKIAKQITATNSQILATTKEVDQARKTWERAIQQYGDASDEAAEAYLAYLKKQTEVQELQNEIVELQDEYFEATVTRRKEIAADRRQLEYDLWELSNPDASEAEKQLKQIEVLQGDYNDAADKVLDAKQAYSDAVINYGEDSIKAQELWNDYLLAAKEALETQKEIDDLQNEALADNTDKFQQMSKLIYGEEGKNLREMGFTDQEIFNWAKNMTGWVEPAAKEAQKEIVEQEEEISETTKESAQRISEMYVTTIQDGVMTQTPLITMTGSEILYALTNGMISEANMEYLLQACQTIMDDADDQMNSDENIEAWVSTGDNIMAGLTEGVNNQGPVFLDAIIAWIQKALIMAQQAAGIHSPSRETMWMAEMLVRGAVVGIEDYGYLAVQAMGGLMDDIVDTARTSSTLEFAGSLIAGGIADGMDDMTATVSSASHALIQRTIDAFNETLTGNQTFWDRLYSEYGAKQEDFSYEVVLSLSTDKAYEELSDFEKAVIDVRALGNAYTGMNIRGYEDWLSVGGGAVGEYEKYKRLLAARENYENELAEVAEEYGKQSNQYQTALGHLEMVEDTISSMENSAAYKSYVDEMTDLANQRLEAWATAESLAYHGWQNMIQQSQGGTSLEDARVQYTQNIYSTKPLSTLDVYRNTNKLLSTIS